jgi:hypothetical protein
MKKATQLAVAIVIFWIGCIVGYSYSAKARYDRAWADGNSNGWSSGVKFQENLDGDVRKAEQSLQHHYKFETRGAAIYRFDLDTGEVCYMRISVADSGTPIKQCPH